MVQRKCKLWCHATLWGTPNLQNRLKSIHKCGREELNSIALPSRIYNNKYLLYYSFVFLISSRSDPILNSVIFLYFSFAILTLDSFASFFKTSVKSFKVFNLAQLKLSLFNCFSIFLNYVFFFYFFLKFFFFF